MKHPTIPLKKHQMETRFTQPQIKVLGEMVDANRLSVAQVSPPQRCCVLTKTRSPQALHQL
ncbi:hypothetical protein NG791_25160 [Laspinema sp. D1]|uniref:hypothetical protein n=1 Tax=Laspinema palackyanum TaxID=3231601 RepID=UPI00346982EA|nr:hypothetical protein [Laspinema sp. D2b]